MITGGELIASLPLLGDATAATLNTAAEAAKELGLHDIYANGMRNSLFTGFITVSGFLLTAKTFLVVNMNKEVYTSEHYLENFRVQKKLDNTLEVYGPLNNIATLLYWNIVLTITTAVFQFTIGFIPSPWTAGICLAIAAFAIIFLGYSLSQVRNNLIRMFAFMESVAKTKLDELGRKAEQAKAQRRQEREGPNPSASGSVGSEEQSKPPPKG